MPAKSQAKQQVGAAAFSAKRAAMPDGRLKTRRAIWSDFRSEKQLEYLRFPTRNAKPQCV